jgi:hypothetical protein
MAGKVGLPLGISLSGDIEERSSEAYRREYDGSIPRTRSESLSLRRLLPVKPRTTGSSACANLPAAV